MLPFRKIVYKPRKRCSLRPGKFIRGSAGTENRARQQNDDNEFQPVHDLAVNDFERISEIITHSRGRNPGRETTPTPVYYCRQTRVAQKVADLKVRNILIIEHLNSSEIIFISNTNFVKVFKKIFEYCKLLSLIGRTKTL